MTTTAFHGPWLRAPNLSADSVGSIHDDAEAKSLGFRAALVGGSVLSAFLTPALVELFGPAWYERGFLKQTFVKPIYETDQFRVVAEDIVSASFDERLVSLSLDKQDGESATLGYAGLVASAEAAIPPWDRPGEPQLAVAATDRDPLPDEALGAAYPSETINITPETPLNLDRRVAANDDSSWYTDASPWGGPIVPTFVYIMLAGAGREQGGSRRGGSGVQAGMNATFQLLQTGPMHCNQPHELRSVLVEKGFSRRTAFRTVEHTVLDSAGKRVAVTRQKVRWFPR